ncbi:Rho guanine nucleotide exchange factor 6 [Nowakowskiella sp. JEL0078]|nr:Rho guanine nucleotide exchange factor 6 [Nowakowskiella sp. JEL0078]
MSISHETKNDNISGPNNTNNSTFIEAFCVKNLTGKKGPEVTDFATVGSVKDTGSSPLKIISHVQSEDFSKSFNPEPSMQDSSKFSTGLSSLPMNLSTYTDVPNDVVTPYSQKNTLIYSNTQGDISEQTIRTVKSASNFESNVNKSGSVSNTRSRPRTSVRPLSTKIKLRKQSTYNPPIQQNESESQNSNAIISEELKMSPVQTLKQPEIGTALELDVEHSFLLKPENLTFHISTYPYSAGKNDELAFQEGQIIRVIRQVIGGWWEGQHDQQIGWFPENYTEPFSIEGLSEEDAQKFAYDQFANSDEDIDALRSRNIVKNIKDKEDDTTSENIELENLELKSSNSAFESVIPEGDRTSTVKEIIKVERLYMEVLRKCKEEFVDPLSKESFLLPQDHQKLFTDILRIYELQSDVCASIQKIENQPEERLMIGQIYQDLEDRFMDVYVLYSVNIQKTVDTASNYNANVGMENFLASTSARDASPMIIHLVSLLHKPIQHKQKLLNLLKELYERTPELHPDYDCSISAYRMYGDMIDSMEITKRKKESIDIVNNVMKKIQGWEVALQIIGPGLQHFGELVIEGNLKLLENGRNHARSFYLLQKLLVILREEKSFKKKDTQYKVVEKIQISRSNLQAVREVEDELGLSFLLSVRSEDSTIRNLVVTAYNPEQRNCWILNISKELEKNTKTAFPSLPVDLQNEIRRLSGPEAIRLSPKGSGLQRSNSSGEHLKYKTKKFFKGLGAILRRPSILGFKELSPELQNLEPPIGEILPNASNNLKPASEASSDGFSIRRRKDKDSLSGSTVYRSDSLNGSSDFRTRSSNNSDSRTNSLSSSQSPKQETNGISSTTSTLSFTSAPTTPTSPFATNPLNYVGSIKKKASRNVLSTLSQGLGGYFSNSEIINSEIIQQQSTTQSPNSESPINRKLSKTLDPQTSQISVIDLETHLPTNILTGEVEPKIRNSKDFAQKSDKTNTTPLADKLDEIFTRNGVNIINEITSRKTVEISVPSQVETGSIVQAISVKNEADILSSNEINVDMVEDVLQQYDSSSPTSFQAIPGQIIAKETIAYTNEIQEEILNVKWNPQLPKDDKKMQSFRKLNRNNSSSRPSSDLFDLMGSKISSAFRTSERDGNTENTTGVKPIRKPSKLTLNPKDQLKANKSEVSTSIPDINPVLSNNKLEQHPVVIDLISKIKDMEGEIKRLTDRVDTLEKIPGLKNVALEE